MEKRQGWWLELGQSQHRLWEPQVSLEIQVVGLLDELKSHEGERADKDDSEFLEETQEMRIQFVLLSLNS